MVRAFVVLLLCTVISGCALPRGAALKSEMLKGAKDENAPFQLVEMNTTAMAMVEKWPAKGASLAHSWPGGSRGSLSYRITAGDVLAVTIWDSQDNSLLTAAGQKQTSVTDLLVSPSGTIFLPYVGEVNVAGQSIESARNTIATRMEAIAPSAQVLLTAQQGQNSTVRAVSGVAAPGAYPLPDSNYTVLNLLSDAGGVARDMDNPVVRLLRNGATYETYVQDLTSNDGNDLVLRGGDKVVVEDLPQTFIAMGATGNQQLISIKHPPVNAIEAITMAGGLSPGRADPKGVLILREYPRNAIRQDTHGPQKESVVFAMNLTTAEGLFAANNLEIQPDDIVYVSESPVPSLNAALNLFRLGGSSATVAGNLGN